MNPLENYERQLDRKELPMNPTKRKSLTPYFAVFFIGLIAGFLLALPLQGKAQTLLKQEEGFPLNVPIHEPPGFAFCASAEDATKVVSVHATEGIEKAREFFKMAKCANAPMRMTVVYKQRLYSVILSDGTKRNVYEAYVLLDETGRRAYRVFIITDWTHRETGA